MDADTRQGGRTEAIPEGRVASKYAFLRNEPPSHVVVREQVMRTVWGYW